MNDRPIIYDNDGNEIYLPWRWEICGACNGHGKTSRDVECDGGGFTASEWYEQDEDFRRDYMAGFYDRPCEACGGSGKVKVADESQMTPEQIECLRADAEANAQVEAAERCERRMLGW